MLKVLSTSKIDQLSTINFSYVRDIYLVSDFLKNSVQLELKTLHLDFSNESQISRSNYTNYGYYRESFNYLWESLSNWVQLYGSIEISNVYMWDSELHIFLKTFQCCRRIGIVNSEIVTPTPCNFSTINKSEIKIIDLHNSSSKSKWSRNLKRFRNILIGITRSESIKSKIEKIIIGDYFDSIEQEEGEQMLKELDLDEIELDFNVIDDDSNDEQFEEELNNEM